MNTFDVAFYDEKLVTGFEIQFARESVEGDMLDVYQKQTAENEYSFAINKGDETIIKARIEYRRMGND